MTIREQVEALPKVYHGPNGSTLGNGLTAYVPTDAVLAVFAERERLLRARIQALPKYSIDAREWRRMVCLTDVLGAFDD